MFTLKSIPVQFLKQKGNEDCFRDACMPHRIEVIRIRMGSRLKRRGERETVSSGMADNPSQRALITDCPVVSRIRKIGSPQ